MWRKQQQVSHLGLACWGWTVGGALVSKALLVLTVSLENVLMDVRELTRGMELTKREYSMHGHNTMLKEFIGHNESKLKKLQDDAKIAQVSWVSSDTLLPGARLISSKSAVCF